MRTKRILVSHCDYFNNQSTSTGNCSARTSENFKPFMEHRRGKRWKTEGSHVHKVRKQRTNQWCGSSVRCFNFTSHFHCIIPVTQKIVKKWPLGQDFMCHGAQDFFNRSQSTCSVNHLFVQQDFTFSSRHALFFFDHFQRRTTFTLSTSSCAGHLWLHKSSPFLPLSLAHLQFVPTVAGHFFPSIYLLPLLSRLLAMRGALCG